MPASAAYLLQVAKRAEKLGEISAAFDAYSKVLNNFPSHTAALKRRFDLDLLRKREPKTKTKESREYEKIKKKMELGVSDLTMLKLEKFIFDNPNHKHLEADAMAFTTHWLRKKKRIQIVPDLCYEHRVRPQSYSHAFGSRGSESLHYHRKLLLQS